ncbi:MAG: methyltransferase domain-containing protein [Frankiaceae bacterium]|nr:methyltransferase domain-containing protein [Frankiaceae bacterium]MBV9872882.1 methyltransferase domain-containing protein [Frankiaceae bacterium]
MTPGETGVRVIANAEMAAAWDGPEGEHWAHHADRYEQIGERQLSRLLSAAEVSPTDTVLDIGCGTGAATRAFALAASEGAAVGIDLSSQMLQRARDKATAAGIPNVSFVQGDAQVHEFPAGEYSLAVSAMGTMFFADPVAAFTNIGQALQPGGRLAILTWRALELNEWLTAVRGALAVGRDLPSPPLGAPGPFGLADPDHVRHVLDGAGFTGIDLTPSNEPAIFGSDANDAFDFVSSFGITRGLTQGLSEADRATAMANLRQIMTDHATLGGVEFATAAWLITARRSS